MTTNTASPFIGSFASAVVKLKPGESVSRVKAIDPKMTVAKLSSNLPEIRQKMRNAVTPAVTRATEKTGLSYGIEVGEVIMPKGSMYSVAVVTCGEG